MKVSKAAAVSLWVEIGFKTAAKWTDEEMQAKFGKLLKMVEAEEANVESKENQKLLAEVIETLKAGKSITITGTEAKAAPAKEEKPAKKAKAAPAPEPEEDDEEDEDDSEDDDSDEDDSDEDDDEDEDDEEEAPAPKAKKAAKKPAKDEDEEDDDDDEEEKPAKKESKKGKPFPKGAGKDGKPGVIASIVEFLNAASEDKPISKKRLTKKLAERFEDRSAESMAKTVNVQVPNRLMKDKGMNIIKTDKGYYVGEGKPAKKAEKEESKKAKKAAKAAPPADDDDEDDDE